MKIKLNEQDIDISSEVTLNELCRTYKPNADIKICNGAICEDDIVICENDHIMLIKRGEIPSAKELEIVMTARHTPGIHETLKRSCVGIAGLGGLGSSVAIALARIGIGKLILVDFDVVEPSNLNRQQYFVDQLGMLKTDALKDNLRRINPYVNLSCHSEKIDKENINQLFSDAKVLIEAFDRPDQKAMLLASAKNNFIVAASGLAGYGSCDNIQVSRLGKNIYIVGDLETGAAPGCGLMAPRVGVAAHLQANLTMQLLLD